MSPINIWRQNIVHIINNPFESTVVLPQSCAHIDFVPKPTRRERERESCIERESGKESLNNNSGQNTKAWATTQA